MPDTSIDWEGALWDTISHLQTLIRIDTVNPPGNEIGAARYMDDVLRGAGIETTLLLPAAGRAALVARLRGNGSRRPVLLLAHMDVVGVEREHWKQNPFGGEIVDGHIYGRGAIDDKGMLATNLMTMLLLKRHVIDEGKTLTRDVVFVATSDEEAGGRYGINWLVEHHAELLDAEFAINEGGRIRVVNGRPLYCAVQCAEKVPHIVTVTARGTSGHASIPRADNAVVRLGRALATIGAHREPVQLTEITRRFFADLAEVWPVPRQAKAMAQVVAGDSRQRSRAAAILAEEPSLDAALRNGISPTMLTGGIRTNVIPADAAATMSVRTLPGVAITDVVERLQAAIADPDVEIRVNASGNDAPPSPVSSVMFDAIAASARALEPALAVVPYMSNGSTDSGPLRRLGVQAYGLLPFPLPLDDEERMHGHDERVSVSSLGFGVQLLYDVVRRVTAR